MLNSDIQHLTVTQGNHTVTQSTFSSPCIPAHVTNSSVNGFDSSFRNANNGTSVTNLPVTITDSNVTIWFYDVNTCALGGVGGININGSSTETLDGFKVRHHLNTLPAVSTDVTFLKRNAVRLNGTTPTSTSSIGTQETTTTTPGTEPTSTSSANRAIFVASSFSLTLLTMILGLSL